MIDAGAACDPPNVSDFAALVEQELLAVTLNVPFVKEEPAVTGMLKAVVVIGEAPAVEVVFAGKVQV